MKFLEKLGLVVLLMTVFITVLALANPPLFTVLILLFAASVGSVMFLFPD